MTTNYYKRHTATASDQVVAIQASHGITFGVKSENADATFAVTVKITDNENANEYTLDTVEDGKAKTFLGGIKEFVYDISDMGTSTWVDVEILGVTR